MNIKINISYKEFCIAQISIVSFILSLGLASYIFRHLTGHNNLLGLFPKLDLSAEISLCNYFESLNLFLSSLFLFAIYKFEKVNLSNGFNYWLLLSIIFLIMSIDESIGFSDVIKNMYEMMANRNSISEEGYTENIQRIIITILIGIILVPFLKLLTKQLLIKFLIAGFIYLTGIIGIDSLGVVMFKTGIVEESNDFLYLIRRLIEEGFEMFGIVIFNCTLYGLLLKKY